jgi:hypothetical protein
MEINKFEDVIGVVPTSGIVEGRFGLMCPHTFDYDFGSRVDLPGIKVPATAAEAINARYCVTFSPDNGPTPFYDPMVVPAFAQRGGWDQAPIGPPYSAQVYVTHRSNQEELTIPSGMPCLGFTDGTFTLPSGGYIHSADIIIIGANVVVANTAEDGLVNAGRLKWQNAYDYDRVVGTVKEYDADTLRLTVRID